MPGAVGAVSFERTRDVTAGFERMVAVMQHHSRLRTETVVSPDRHWALGRVHLGILNSTEQLRNDDEIVVIFHGDLHNVAELAQTDQARQPGDSSSEPTQLIRAAYLRYGKDVGLHLRGAFFAIVFDKRCQRLFLINDLVGTYPVYWMRSSTLFAFSSEVRALTEATGCSPTLCASGLADFVKFGFLTGARTLAEGMCLLMHDTTLEIDLRSTSMQLHSNRRLEDILEANGEEDRSHAMTQVRQCFNDAVADAVADEHRYVISISGGLDSRAIVSAVNTSDTEFSSYTDGVRGCADEVIAEEIARLLGTRHQFLELDEAYLKEFMTNLREMTTLTDGMYLSHGLTEMLAFPHIREMGYEVLLRGHGGELAKTDLAWPLHTDSTVQKMRSMSELIPYLLKRMDYITSDALPQGLFTGDWEEKMRGRARIALEESLADFRGTPTDACALLYLKEHHRRYTTASLELFRNEVEVRLPFVDEPFLRSLWDLPPSQRRTTAIHKDIISGNSAALGRIRNSNTGAAACAHPLVETVIEKFNALLARLNFPGFRHYHDFSAWMKRSLLDTIEQELLSSQSLNRGILERAGLQKLIDETRTGFRDHGYLLQILLTVEFWQQENHV